MLQTLIIASLFIASKINRATSRYKALRPRWKFFRRSSHSKSSRFRLKLARCFSAIQAITVDFQEAQAVFVSTTQIATLWFYSQAEVTQNSSSYAEANATIAFAFTIAIYGLIPVLLGQSVLQRAGKHWWYTTILTCIPTVLAWWCTTRPIQPDYATLWAKLEKSSTATECGGNAIPMDYCGGPYQTVQYSYPLQFFNPDPTIISAASEIPINSIFIPIIRGVVYIGAPFLLADQVYVWIRGSPHWSRISRFCKRVSRWSKLRISTKSRIVTIVHLINFLIWFIYQALLFTALIYNLFFFLFVLGSVTGMSGGWSYGQLVAVLVWLPIGLKLVYYIICKLYSRS